MKSSLLNESFQRSRMMKRISKNSMDVVFEICFVERAGDIIFKLNFKNKTVEK